MPYRKQHVLHLSAVGARVHKYRSAHRPGNTPGEFAAGEEFSRAKEQSFESLDTRSAFYDAAVKQRKIGKAPGVNDGPVNSGNH